MICVSTQLEKIFLEYKFPREKIVKAYYGIDYNIYTPVGNETKKKYRKELGLKEDCFTFLFVGGINPRKNVEIIIKAFHLFRAKYSSSKLIIVGPINKNSYLNYFEYLKNLISNLGMNNHIQFLGERNSMQNIYQVADVYITASKAEGLSIANLEAMSTGLPCIASNIEAFKDHF